MRIAVLMACHNRRGKTLACLGSLHAQALPAGVTLETWLVDDASTDGTAQAVVDAYPDVRLLRGDGSLYWCGGMRLAWPQAARTEPDSYLWLNDDVVLEPDAVQRLVNTGASVAAVRGVPVVVVGACRDPDTGAISYGGMRRPGRHPARLQRMEPGIDPLPCDTFEGNVVLVSADAFRLVGGMRAFSHAIADTDYGYRAWKAGCAVYMAPGVCASCAANRGGPVWRQADLPLRTRWRAILGPKGLPPSDWFRFLRAHAGWRWPFYWAAPYVRVLLGA